MDNVTASGFAPPMSVALKISNRDARRLWLDASGLGPTPTGPLDLMQMIRRLGFVQIDTIRNVTRAHNHILWSRNQSYREGMVWSALSDRQIFEHFTHDASLIPTEFFAYWGRQFRRLSAKTRASDWYKHGLGITAHDEIKARIQADGPLSTHAFDTKVSSREMWARPPHKKALDLMWYSGELATSHRENFVKYYDLGHRIFPHDPLDGAASDAAQLNWLCHAAMDRMGIATLGEVQRFWGAATSVEVRSWAAETPDLVPVEILDATGAPVRAVATADIETRLATAPAPSSRLRLVNPFDPTIRERPRTARLFGFDYRNEMFVPKSQRIWGYYVYPLLEGDRFVGRLEAKGDRKTSTLTATGFWSEPGCEWSPGRGQKLAAELARFARLAGLATVTWDCPAPPGA